MNRLTLFQTIAYEARMHESGLYHFVNDVDYFREFYALCVRKNADCVDAGFNVGIQSEVMLTVTNGKIFAFEASKKIFDYARDKFAKNARVYLFNLAVSNRTEMAEFYDTELWGAGSLKKTAGMAMCHANDYQVTPVRLCRLDDILSDEKNIGLIKLDIEGAEILALDGARSLLRRNRPYLVMEYSHNAMAFEYKGKAIDRMTLYEFAKEIGYKVYNIYGICLSDLGVWQASIFRDTADVFLIPEEEHDRWVNEMLPKYQYRVYDKISEAIEWSDKARSFFGIVGMPSRIYEFLNTYSKEQSLEYLSAVSNRLREAVRDRKEIFTTNKLSRRGEVLLALLYDGKVQEGYTLGMIKDITPQQLESFERSI